MSDKKQKKPQKLKARLARGFPDRSPADIRATDEMMAKIRQVYERFGFEPVETPFVEYTDALGKFLPDQDRPNEGVFSFQDDDEQWLSLRYDLTAPLARHVAENFNDIQLPYRTYRSGWVFRNEKPGPGRFRQFMQFDADIVGAPGVSADAEMCMMMADTMEALGIPRGDYVIRVNNRKVLDGVMEAIGLGGEENAGKRLTVLRAIDKLDKFGIEGVKLLLGPGRWDGGKADEGDFTPGAGLESSNIDAVLDYVQPKFPLSDLILADGRTVDEQSDQADRISDDAIVGKGRNNMATIGSIRELFETPNFQTGLNELEQIAELANAAGFGPDRVLIDPSVVRGLEYYTGPVFEAELLFDVTNEKGQKVQFGSVGGGGRYDGLVSRFMGQPVPATGFSIGVSRLMTALKNLGKISGEAASGPILVTVMDRDRVGDYAKMAQDLRTALNPLGPDNQPTGPAIPVELFQGNPKDFPKQLRYADRRGAPIAIIQGGNEKALGKLIVKDLIEGKRIAETITDNALWREAKAGEHLVDEADLLVTVKRILAEQASDAQDV
ncbi:MAG: histidine--tRNA ligase [Hoeflea sp.]|uniref:histidine--tRNA ligase n=1 Tax=Hoeflea sp. TaxID=1940281 RepID=UPI001DC41FB2|nr:histidine--tRNA ligase [Hoeflea sp.]MBU4529138.1 histidine--tRNA ligase [Alphaproteobacteria bacterium]MBU4543543.1 histidine--tRNA ligase [Alphaproteobacteria bacterium]MBU4549168.1 histidine--tRNA ligase [Alphaproteobacteria bacterium]MBV1725303.1 histidine--tRNA ligase [Hoeflea sp.]MBV1785264.1 histidine--tRNA ligase [Hoeflea sp.]